MASKDWEHEMNRMLEIFANQATVSLGKINRRFETLGRPFDEKFRQYFLNMSNQRLNMSFDTVLFSNGPTQNNAFGNGASTSSHTAEIQAVHLLKNENVNHGGLIEIFDSDDDEHSETEAASNAIDSNNGTDEKNGSSELSNHNNQNTQNDTMDLDSKNVMKSTVKNESNAESESVELPLVQFDPIKENGGIVVANQIGECSKTQRPSQSSNAGSDQSKRNHDRRFKCEHCDSSFKNNWLLKQHQPVHANGKLIGLKADSKRLYHCSHCARHFTNVGHLSNHMKFAHKDDQYLYECARCMRKRFVRKADKDRHESQCEGHHYECYLCKVYVVGRQDQMQRHMRKHSGAKPFQCMVCNKSYQQKFFLKRHLNSVHSRKK